MAKDGLKFDVDTKLWIRQMNKLDDELLPKTVTKTVNTLGRGFYDRVLKSAEKELIIRSSYTRKSFFIWQSKYKPGRRLDRINTVIGTKSPYLPIQEKGGTIKAQDQRIPIPTLRARTSKSIQKPIAKRYRMNQLGTFDGGSKFFMGKPRGTNWPVGIYERYGKGKLRMIRNLEKSQVRIKPTHFFTNPLDYFTRRDVWNRTFMHHARIIMREYLDKGR